LTLSDFDRPDFDIFKVKLCPEVRMCPRSWSEKSEVWKYDFEHTVVIFVREIMAFERMVCKTKNNLDII
jgi:hypothetical protein